MNANRARKQQINTPTNQSLKANQEQQGGAKEQREGSGEGASRTPFNLGNSRTRLRHL